VIRMPDLRKEIAKLGPTFTPDTLQRTRELYRPSVSALAASAGKVLRDIAYGDHARHRLDLFPPSAAHAPVVLFLHGGGFVGGDKSGDPLFYANVGHYFAGRGYLAITTNYRLAPEYGWPAGSDDVAAVLQWIVKEAAAYGGDPSRIVVIGQSAGAAHLASYLFLPRFAAAGRISVRGAILMSGFYRASAPLEGGPRLYFGEDEESWNERSPINHLSADHPPLLLSVAELDPAAIAVQTLDLAMALNACDGRPPRQSWFEGHNHVSTVHGLGVDDDVVGKSILAFARSVTA
jgi:acetyl esterase/lipase